MNLINNENAHRALDTTNLKRDHTKLSHHKISEHLSGDNILTASGYWEGDIFYQQKIRNQGGFGFFSDIESDIERGEKNIEVPKTS